MRPAITWPEDAWSLPGEAMTLAEFEAAAEDSHDELSRGMLVREPVPGARHARVAGRLYEALAAHVASTGGGESFVDCGFLLHEEPPTLRLPDVAWISPERLPEDVPVGPWRIAPDLAVEVVSPTNRVGDMRARVLDYLEAGTRHVWVIDPETRSALVYRSRIDIRLLAGDDDLAAEDLLPGFRLHLPTLFG